VKRFKVWRARRKRGGRPPSVSLVAVAPLWRGFDRADDQVKLLLLKTDHIGDFFLFLPAAEIIRAAWPKARLTLACAPQNAELAEATGLFDNIISFQFFAEHSEDQRRTGLAPPEELQRLAPETYDLAVDFRHDGDSRPLLAKLNARYRAGFSTRKPPPPALDLCLHEVARGSKGSTVQHNAERLMLLASAVAHRFKPPDFGFLASLAMSGTVPADVPAEDFVVVAPGGGTSTKKWPKQNYAELAGRIARECAMKIVVIGGERETEFVEAMARQVPDGALIDLLGRTKLIDLPELINRARFFIGNDTGATHYAALLGVPTLCIFSGVAHVDIWRPLGAHVRILRANVACSPCWLLERSACEYQLECLTAISPDRAFAEFSAALQHQGTRCKQPM
jgi:ADP-heptose:LPS heptosyltransferase